ncbi:RNA polymerase sigma factor [Planctomycetes bacterium CA13]|uniref:RNA polymerase sigma factor n=1 Tax=Novipirellula herctigrandis TaxID=2527986 RepID=A0A5C5YZS9_9BACT|nr:RNA polymerase sigma factor [Planctomycetes bacterium CA13]
MKRSKRVERFNRLRAEHSEMLTSVLWKLAGDREVFAEAFQNALMGIWEHIEKLDDQHAGGYIYRITLSANSKAWRNRLGRDGCSDQSWGEAEACPEDMLDQNETATTIRQAVAELPTKQSQAVALRYLEAQDYETIAKQMSCSQAGARSLVSKAIATLRTKLESFIEQE